MKGVYKMSGRLKQEAAEYRSALYRENPEAERFMKTKRVLLYGLMTLLLLHELACLALMFQDLISFSYLPSNLVKDGVHFLLLGAALAGGWKASLLLYLTAAPSVVTLAASWEVVRSAGDLFAVSPWLAALLCTEVVYTILLAAAVLWLTMLPKSRRLAEEARQIYLKYLRFVNDHLSEMQEGW